MTHLYLIRHGESTRQVGEILRDEGLTPLGIRQAEHLRDRLAGTQEIQADVLIASTLPRARQTAEIIAPALDLPIIFDDEVQELRDGEAEGMHIDEFTEKYGRPDFTNNPFRPIAPGGENWGQFTLRVATSLDRITREYEGKSIVIVCHGGIIDSSFLYFFGMNSFSLLQTRFLTQNTSITYWRKDNRKSSSANWRLVRYNDDFHLRDIETQERIPWEDLPYTRKQEGKISQPDAPSSSIK